MQQVVPNERGVVAHRPAMSERREVLAEVDGVAAHLVSLEVLRLHVRHRPRELDVGKKEGTVVAAGLSLVVEQGVEDVCLQRIVRRRETFDERPHPDQVVSAHLRVVRVGVGVWCQLGEISVDEVGVGAQVRLALQKGVHLLEQESAVYVEFAEAAALLRSEVGKDQFDQLVVVRAVESREQSAAAAGGQFDAPVAENPVERRFLEPAQIVVVFRGEADEGSAGDAIRVEAGWKVWLLARHLLALVSKMKAKFMPDPFQCPIGVAVVGGQPLAPFDQVAEIRRFHSLTPLREDVLQLSGLAGILVMQRVIEVIIFGTGNKLLQGSRPILGESEGFDISDGIGRDGRTGNHRSVSGDEDSEGQEKVFHRTEASHALVFYRMAVRILTWQG